MSAVYDYITSSSLSCKVLLENSLSNIYISGNTFYWKSSIGSIDYIQPDTSKHPLISSSGVLFDLNSSLISTSSFTNLSEYLTILFVGSYTLSQDAYIFNIRKTSVNKPSLLNLAVTDANIQLSYSVDSFVNPLNIKSLNQARNKVGIVNNLYTGAISHVINTSPDDTISSVRGKPINVDISTLSFYGELQGLAIFDQLLDAPTIQIILDLLAQERPDLPTAQGDFPSTLRNITELPEPNISNYTLKYSVDYPSLCSTSYYSLNQSEYAIINISTGVIWNTINTSTWNALDTNSWNFIA